VTATVLDLSELISKQSELEALAKANEQTQLERKAPNSRKAYARWVVRFDSFRRDYRLPNDSNTLALFLQQLAGLDRSISTIKQAYAGVIDSYGDLRSEQVSRTIQGITQQHKDKGKTAKTKPALTLEIAQDILAAIHGDSLRSLRNRAMLSVQWVTASRPSELLGLCVSHIVLCPDIITLEVFEKDHSTSRLKTIAKDKPLGAFEHLQTYLNQAGLESGPIWRKVSRADNPCKTALKNYSVVFADLLEGAGLARNAFTPHCVRTGYVTSQAMAGASLAEIIAVTGHQNIESVKHYFDRALMLRNNPMDKLK